MRRSAARLSRVVAVLVAGLLAAGCGSSITSSIGSLPSRTATVSGRPSVTAQPPTHSVTTAAPATGSAAPGASSGTSLTWLWVLLGVLVLARPDRLDRVLASDAVLSDGELIGDPTEGALVALAAKGGVDAVSTRQAYPRIAELPFDAAYKLMATFHKMTDASGKDVIRCYVKGAPDQLLARAATVFDAESGPVPADEKFRELYQAENRRLGEQGLRVLATARKDLDPAAFDPSADLLPLVTGLELLSPGRDRGPAPPHRQGIHRHGQGRRDQSADDHRGSRGHRGRDRPRTRHRRHGHHRGRVRGDERRRGAGRDR